ncbi:PIG-L deacetylase family protein [Actinorugispora endophytica]|uniref:LmbE family N-acetylglucosaminyl deacetylase n=1 Tax=Actinorugispora endophytica TaxID=1605990 RepID=A0A4R6V4G8_9ACTN|nr:PIG-L family deacetylase [Actinorugispora endophytica]TDQ55305.1 LmbE family N-acetylglucosaminyl deacetylase [Actinorugispora endophytica]
MTIDWSRERILILAPHPDDETLGCGGLIRKAKDAGAEVYIQFITVGDTEDNSARGPSTAQERYGEIKEVADFFGWDGWDFAFPGDEYHLKLDVLSRFELSNAIERHSPLSVTTLKPTVVITPHHTSYNQDHQATAEAVHTALRPSDNRFRHHPRLVLAYEEAADQWRQDTAPPPNFFVELTEAQVDAKIEAMHLYGSQAHAHPHTRSDLTLRSLAALRGMHVGVPFAEGYHTLRCLV